MRNPKILEVISGIGVSVAELAEKTGWSVDDIIEYMTTPRDVPDDVIGVIAAVLNVDAAAFKNEDAGVSEP